MERFAFKIDNALKAKLYKICRLCGIDNPPKVSILMQDALVQEDDDELPLSTKIKELIGLQVTKTDKMPQSICMLCMDKINDFFEFRAMCVSTNVQTRKLLGLKEEEVMPPVDMPDDDSLPLESGTAKRRGRKRKSEEIKIEPGAEQVLTVQGAEKKARLVEQKQIIEKQLKLLELEMKPTKEITEAKKLKAKNIRVRCRICSEGFPTDVKLCKHIANVHVPDVPRYHCSACNETLRKGADIKNHQFWHKLSQTPYKCDMCPESRTTLYTFTKHIRTHLREFKVTTFGRKCPVCVEPFATSFLYNAHACVRQTLQCGGCGQRLAFEAEHLLHTAHCTACYDTPTPNLPFVKDEENNMNAMDTHMLGNEPYVVSAIEEATHSGSSAGGHSATKSRKSLAAELQRVENLFKTTMDTLVSMKHEPEVHIKTEQPDGEVDMAEDEPDDDPDYNEEPDGDDAFADDADEDDVTDSGFQQDDDTQSDRTTGLDILAPIVSIKTEPMDEFNASGASAAAAAAVDSAPTPLASSMPPNKLPVLRLKIKKEHGALNASFTNGMPKLLAVSKGNRLLVKREVITPPPPSTSPPPPANASRSNETTAEPQQTTMRIRVKQEPLDADDIPESSSSQHNQATVMTVIPGSHMPMSYLDNPTATHEAEENVSTGEEDTTLTMSQYSYTDAMDEDIKPSREELNRLLRRSGNISMAMNSYSGIPQIAAVSSGTEAVATFSKYSEMAETRHHRGGVRVKPEPRYDQGYEDTLTSAGHSVQGMVRIKQEPGCEISIEERNVQVEDNGATAAATDNDIAESNEKRTNEDQLHNVAELDDNETEQDDNENTMVEKCGIESPIRQETDEIGTPNDQQRIEPEAAETVLAAKEAIVANSEVNQEKAATSCAETESIQSSVLVVAPRRPSNETATDLAEIPTKHIEAKKLKASQQVLKVPTTEECVTKECTDDESSVLNNEDAIEGYVASSGDTLSQAQPFSEPIQDVRAMSTIENDTEAPQSNVDLSPVASANELPIDEEQQNVLNHGITGLSHPEVVENMINERQQQLEEEERLLRPMDPPFAPIQPEEGNVNEIAENNNNANIERELQDDAVAAVVALNPDDV